MDWLIRLLWLALRVFIYTSTINITEASSNVAPMANNPRGPSTDFLAGRLVAVTCLAGVGAIIEVAMA